MTIQASVFALALLSLHDRLCYNGKPAIRVKIERTLAMTTAFPLEIFYDGSCVVCSTEIEVYRKQNPQDRLLFIDISSEAFSACAYGKEQADFMAQMHVRDSTGKFFAGVDAFTLIWQAYPAGSVYRLFSRLVGLPGLNFLTRCGYVLFARYRHLLPKRKPDCTSGSCNLNHPR